MRHSHLLIASALLVLLLSSCKKEEAVTTATPVAEPTTPAKTSEPMTEPGAATAPVEASAAAPVNTDFSVESVPVSTASLPPFPFFKTPEGLTNNLDEKESMVGFDRHFFLAGKKLIAVEGKLYHNYMKLKNDDSGRQYSEIEFQKNYENAITALGGKKISTTQFTDEILKEAGGRDAVEKYWQSVSPVSGYEHNSYLIRTPDKEYWIHIATGAIPLHGYVTVLEKEGMKQALDADGRIALYINFDIDKATLRPDSQNVIEEINKLITANTALKLSIEGHTDSSGAPDHNRTLSTARARSVLGALVGLGVDPTRLSSKGFGPDKPIADNGNEEGRAKNRRVELVKM
jgi:OmpA-OmpF porin, OOP family